MDDHRISVLFTSENATPASIHELIAGLADV